MQYSIEDIINILPQRLQKSYPTTFYQMLSVSGKRANANKSVFIQVVIFKQGAYLDLHVDDLLEFSIKEMFHDKIVKVYIVYWCKTFCSRIYKHYEQNNSNVI